MSGAEFWSPVILSLQVTAVSSIFVFLLSVFAAWRMSGARFRGKTAVETIIMLPLVLPPTVVGFALLVAFGRQSPVGQALEWLFAQPVVFTWIAAVIASTVVSFPLVYQTVKTGFESVDKDLVDAARSIGANQHQLLRYVFLPLSARALLSGYILGFARGLGEFGATLMFAGNIPGRTQTIPTAIYLAVESGETAKAWLWCAVIVAISFLLLLAARRKKN